MRHEKEHDKAGEHAIGEPYGSNDPGGIAYVTRRECRDKLSIGRDPNGMGKRPKGQGCPDKAHGPERNVRGLGRLLAECSDRVGLRTPTGRYVGEQGHKVGRGEEELLCAC